MEIACPEDCQYLSSGISYQLVKKRFGALQQSNDPLLRRKYYDVHSNYLEIMIGLEEAIIKFAQGLRSLRDRQIHDSVALLLKTYKTEQSGLIYEHTGTDPLVNSLGRDLKTYLEGHRQLDRDQRYLKTDEIINCLEVLLTDIEYHLAETDQESYLGFITRGRPDLAKSASHSLIL
ncbi:MAG: hypothetical protein ACE15E_22770 [Acidobacteriota bacterium]